MKRILLSLITLAAIFSANAVSPAHRAQRQEENTHKMMAANKKISLQMPHPNKVAGSPTALLFESFEEGKEQTDWLPEGWTRKNTYSSAEAVDHWVVVKQLPYCSAPIDGEQYMLQLFTSEYKDEWMITPEITIPDTDEYVVSYHWWMGCVAWLFVADKEHVDYDTKEYIKQEVAANLEVLVKEGDGEWAVIDDLASHYMGKSYGDLYYMYLDEMQREKVSLAQYAGKTVQIAFRYVGADGESIMVDAVGVDLSSAEPKERAHAWYMPPVCRQFYGFSLDGNLQYMQNGIEFYPVYSPLTWWNMSDNDDATYSWFYTDPETKEEAVCTNQDELTLTFAPDYTSAATLQNNLYPLPTIIAQAEGKLDGKFTGAASCLQAGGRAVTGSAEESTEVRFGVLPFEINNEGCYVYSKDPLDFGRNDIPVFGYSEDSDEWWNNYTFPSGPGEDEFAYVTGYMNYILPQSPMVVSGATASAVGAITNDASFRLEIRALDGDGIVLDPPIATSEISGADVIRHPRGVETEFLSLNFTLPEPIVLCCSDDCAGYVVEVTGYHDPENITYFAPLQSEKPNEYELCMGFYRHHRKFMGVEDDSYSYCAFFQNEYGDLYSTFAISLDATYPWLKAVADDVVEVGNAAVDVPLLSYYDAEQIAIDAPEWLNVEVIGTQSDIAARLSLAPSTPEGLEATVSLSTLGASDSFKVKTIGGAGVGTVGADSDNTNLYNTQGILIKRNATANDLRTLPAGLYLLGSKKIVK